MDGEFDLAKFDEYREDNRLEVKKARNGLPDDLWETYSAFANSNGGCIILGVKEHDDKSWYTTGLKDVGKLKKSFWDTIHNHKKVSVVLLTDDDLKDYEINGDIILVIRVPRAQREDKPVYINNDIWNGTYRRDGEGDYHCTREAVRAMLRDQTEKTTDFKILEDKEIKDLNQDSIKSYRLRYNASHSGHPFVELPDDEFLREIGAASDETKDHMIHPTAAGLLMFGNYQRIIREFPDFLLDYYEMLDPTMRWTDRLASHSGDWSGNVYDFYTKVYFKIAADLKKPFVLDGIYRTDDTPIHVAVREALANCLSNADFLLSGSVVIRKYPDKIVLSNPGTIRLGKKQMLRGGESQPRNKLILNMLNYIGVGERAGSGVPNIYKIWKEENFEEPTVVETSGRDGIIRTIVTLPLVIKGSALANSEKQPEKSPEKPPKHSEIMEKRIAAVLEMIKTNPSISRAEISAKMKISDSQARTAIEKLKERGIIRREGSDTNGKWVVEQSV